MQLYGQAEESDCEIRSYAEATIHEPSHAFSSGVYTL